MLTFLHIVYSKNRMEAWGWCAAEKSKKGIKNVDHMMWISHDIATVREFMFCKVRVWKGYFCNWLRKNWPTLTSSPPLNYHKILNSPLFVPPTRIFFFPPLINISHLKSAIFPRILVRFLLNKNGITNAAWVTVTTLIWLKLKFFQTYCSFSAQKA